MTQNHDYPPTGAGDPFTGDSPLAEFTRYRSRLVEVHEQFLRLQMDSNRVFERLLGGDAVNPVAYQPPAPRPQPRWETSSPAAPIPMVPTVSKPISPISAPMPLAAKTAAPLIKSTTVSELFPLQSTSSPQKEVILAKPETPRPVTSTPKTSPAGDTRRGEIQVALFKIISESTGFPVDMLNLEMNLENDLAIDSIRRVEILGNVQNRFPDAPAIDSSHLGTLTTIGHIIDFLGGAKAGAKTPPTVEPARTASAPKEQGRGEIESALYGIISEKTGFPVGMLNRDMNLENDLAIDSIRRVEILGAVQEKFPASPKIDSSHLGTLKTIGDIVQFLGTGAGSSTSASLAAPSLPTPPPMAGGYSLQEITTSLLNVISEKTGFPKDMLKLDMNLEADLAIDSIRRVEILGAMQDKFPKAPAIDSSQLGVLNTIEQIVHYLSNAGIGLGEKKTLFASH